MAPELFNSWLVLLLLFVTHHIKNKTGLLLFSMAVQIIALQTFYSASFTLGILICHLGNEGEKFNAFFSRSIVKWTCLFIGLYFASYPYTGYEHSTEKSIYKAISFFDDHWHTFTYVIGNALLFMLILHSARLKKIFSARFLIYLGNISFTFYLLHFLILFSFSSWLYSRLASNLIESVNLWVTAMSSFLLIVLLSKLLTRYIDEPALIYLNRMTKKLFGI